MSLGHCRRGRHSRAVVKTCACCCVGATMLTASWGPAMQSGPPFGLRFCASVVGGSLMCWDDFKGVGSPSTLPTSVVGFDAGEVTPLGLGHGHSCAITFGGAVKCWGTGSYSNRSQPATVSSLSAHVCIWLCHQRRIFRFFRRPCKSAASITLGFKPSVPMPQ
jgi:hypothetical protein